MSEQTGAHGIARIRSFSRRGGRMVRQYENVLRERGGEYLLPTEPGETPTQISMHTRVDLDEAFGRTGPLAVEIGPGSGEQLVHFALKNPTWNVLAIEAWNPGVARCIAHAVKADVHNVRILEADAAQALPIIFGLTGAGHDHEGAVDASLDASNPNSSNPRAQMLWTFFPDPWRKARHHRRRLVSASFAYTAAGMLAPSGQWHLATDWDNYAWQMRDVVEANPLFTNPYAGMNPCEEEEEGRGGFAPRWEGRVLTRFEERGIEAGRHIHDVLGVRVP